MAKRGAKAKPLARHELENTTNATRHSGKEPDPGGVIGPPPDYLPDEAKAFWEEAREYLMKMKIGKACDAFSLEAASMYWWRFREASRALIEGGFEQINDRSGVSTRTAAATEATQAAEKLRMWYNEVGFVPSARASLRIPEGTDDDADGELEDRLFSKKSSGLKVS